MMINLIAANPVTDRKLQTFLGKIPPQKDNPNWGLDVTIQSMPDEGDAVIVFCVQIDCGSFEPQIQGVDFT